MSLSPDMQKAQDMLAAMQNQRDQALNAMVNAHADIAALRRGIAELEKELAELKAQKARPKKP